MGFKLPDHKDRAEVAARAKQAVLDKFNAKPEPDAAALAERAARAGVAEAKRLAAIETSRARRESEKQAVLDTKARKIAEAEEEARRIVLSVEEEAAAKKAERDAKYAARKAAKKALKKPARGS